MSDESDGLHSGRFSIIPAAVFEDTRITPTLLRLLGVMGTYGNKDGYCWPKLTTLSTRMDNVSKSAISQGLKQLKELGYLEITPRFDAGGGRIANMYRILYDKTASQLNGGLAPELNGGLAPELNGGLAPELNTLNVPYERPNLTLSSAAAMVLTPREQVDGGAVPEAAAAAACENADKQTAEALRRHLRMGNDKLPGLVLIVRLYPDRRPWLENEANLCFATLKKRPIGLNHFSNWLQEAERRRTAPREETPHGQPTTETAITAPRAPRLTAQQRAAEERAAALAVGLGLPEPYDDA